MSPNGWWEPQNMNTASWNSSHTFTNFQSQQNQDHLNYNGISHPPAPHTQPHNIPLSDHQPYSQIFASTSPTSSVMAAYHHHLNKSFASKKSQIVLELYLKYFNHLLFS